MPFTPINLQERDYNVCLTCIHIGKNCDGPNFLAMTTEQWCEWIRLRKEYLGWTNAHIAEIAGISKVTVDRIMAANTKDIRNTTMQAISKALVNGDWGHYPCAITKLAKTETVYVDSPELLEKLEDAKTNCNRAEQELTELKEKDENTIGHLRSQIIFFEDLLEKKQGMIDNLYAAVVQKNDVIKLLFCLLATAMLVVIIALAFIVF